MPTVLITGASRGIGLEFVRQYAAAGWRVLATCRDPEHRAQGLKEVRGNIAVLRLDVSDLPAIDRLSHDMGAESIDLLLNNAAVYPDASFGHVDYEAWTEAMRVNTMAPLHMAERFVEHVARSDRRLIVSITSRMGSIADNTSGGSYIYRATKAALNAVMRSASLDLANRGIITTVFHPGWVQTAMGGAGALISPATSVSAMRTVIDQLKPRDSGRFFNYDGTEIPW